jgi:hypothetical protein
VALSEDRAAAPEIRLEFAFDAAVPCAEVAQ